MNRFEREQDDSGKEIVMGIVLPKSRKKTVLRESGQHCNAAEKSHKKRHWNVTSHH